jgi:hypothetical protein
MATNGSAVVKFDAAKFNATVANLKKAAASARVGFLKMDKTGTWSYGQDDNEVTEEDHVFIDPNGFVHGWQCWADTDIKGVQSELLGDVKVAMHEPLPDRPDQVPENGRGWNSMAGMSVLLAGEKLVYSTTSVGGLNALSGLAEEYFAQYQKSPGKMIAEVSLSSDSYKHKNKTYGKIFTPVFTVVAWHADLPAEATEAPAPAAPAKKAAAKTPAKKARKAA